MGCKGRRKGERQKKNINENNKLNGIKQMERDVIIIILFN